MSPRTPSKTRALAGSDIPATPGASSIIVCDTIADAEAVSEAWGDIAVSWPGRRSAWHTADWSALEGGRRIVVLSACSNAARARSQALAAHLHGLGVAELRIGLPEGSDRTGPAEWIEAQGRAAARQFIGRLLEPFEPPVDAPKAASAAIPAYDIDWLRKNEYFEILGHEAGLAWVRWGDEIQTMPMESLARPIKLKTLAPPAWWAAKTGEDKITGEVAGHIGWGLASAARERGRIALYDLDGSICGLPGDRILELQTGRIREREKRDRVLRSLAVEPVEGEPTLWLDALRDILEHLGEVETLIEYLRRWFGTSLTTDCASEAMLFCVGRPGCGKSTMLDTWEAVTGSYCATLPGAFVVGQGQSSVRHLVASLRGARVVRVGELPDGGKWAATEDINALVSGETLKADPKYREAVEYRSVAHMMISGNKRPRTDANSGLFRRMRLLALRRLPVQDEEMKERIREPAELGRILSWALSGLRDGGLRQHPVPTTMRAATDAYRESEDAIGRFISDCCVRDDSAMCTFAGLFREFEKWVEDEKMRPWTRQAFAKALNDLDEFPEHKGAGGQRMRIGVRVAAVAANPQESL